MRKQHLCIGLLLLYILVGFSVPTDGDPVVPSDLKILAKCGGLASFAKSFNVRISARGKVTHIRHISHPVDNQPIEETSHTLTDIWLQKIWIAIQDSTFYFVIQSHTSEQILYGRNARLIVSANTRTHDMISWNTWFAPIESAISFINTTPALYKGTTNQISEPYSYLPRDACDLWLVSTADGLLGNPTLQPNRIGSETNTTAATRPGTVEEYHMLIGGRHTECSDFSQKKGGAYVDF